MIEYAQGTDKLPRVFNPGSNVRFVKRHATSKFSRGPYLDNHLESIQTWTIGTVTSPAYDLILNFLDHNTNYHHIHRVQTGGAELIHWGKPLYLWNCEPVLDRFYKVTQDLNGVTRDHVSTLDSKWLHRASETGTYTWDGSTLSNKKRQQSQAAASRIYLVTSLR